MAEKQYLAGDPNSFVWGQGQWQGTGGGIEAQKFYAWKKFAELFGRNPTASELDMLSSAYGSGDANIANVAGGNALVAQYYQNQENSPEKQEAERLSGLREKAPEFYDTIDSQFQSVFGRGATDEEKEHFGSMMAAGTVDAYTIGQYLNQLPEAVKKEDEAFRSQLRGETSAADSRYFNEQVLPGIERKFAQSGRSFDSSGYANALAQAAQQQNVSRENFLTNLSADQYSGNKSSAYNEYLNSVGRLQAGQDYSRNRRDVLSDSVTNRLYDIQNFNMQKQAYDQYLSRYGKRSNGTGIGSLAGGIIGGGLGAYLGGSAGASAGYGMGSGIGGGFGSFF